jgi:iron complex transport system permease protein
MKSRTVTAGSVASKAAVGLVLLILLLLLCTMTGSHPVSLKNALTGDSEAQGHNIDYEIIFGSRLPRVILAAIVGAALACAGVTLQAILRNPLADPYILGISSGAGLGGALAIMLTSVLGSWAGVSVGIFAFVGAFGTVWLVWLIGHFTTGRSSTTSLLLAGVVVNAFFSALIMFLTQIARSYQLREIWLWLMGSITEKSIAVIGASAAAILSGLLGLFSIAQRLNVLTLGRTEAQGLGVATARTNLIAFALSAFVTSVAVSLSGLIGFVGLIVPHGVRLIFGPDHRQLLPLSAISGAALLAVADTLARTVIAPAQLPVGIITAITGGPFFLILLARYNRKVGWVK